MHDVLLQASMTVLPFIDVIFRDRIIIGIVYVDKIVKGNECLHELCLKRESIFRGRHKYFEAFLQYTEDSFDHVSCLSMAKIEKFLVISRPGMSHIVVSAGHKDELTHFWFARPHSLIWYRTPRYGTRI
jgi:hypothetical protein